MNAANLFYNTILKDCLSFDFGPNTKLIKHDGNVFRVSFIPSSRKVCLIKSKWIEIGVEYVKRLDKGHTTCFDCN